MGGRLSLDAILAALDTVTRRDDEAYEAFIERAACNDIGRAVKIADLQDNLDLSRIGKPTQADFARMDRYRAALQYLDGQRPAPAED